MFHAPTATRQYWTRCEDRLDSELHGRGYCCALASQAAHHEMSSRGIHCQRLYVFMTDAEARARDDGGKQVEEQVVYFRPARQFRLERSV